MTPSSPSAHAQGQLVFGLEELPPDDDDIPDDLKTPDELSRSVSMYVRIFAGMYPPFCEILCGDLTAYIIQRCSQK